MVFFNAGGLAVGDLPCTTATNPLCLIAISHRQPGHGGRRSVAAFGAKVTNPAFSTATGVFTGNVGGNGTINAVGVPITDGMGNFVPFTGQAATSWGFPGTTGKLTISVTQNAGCSDRARDLHPHGWRQSNGRRLGHRRPGGRLGVVSVHQWSERQSELGDVQRARAQRDRGGFGGPLRAPRLPPAGATPQALGASDVRTFGSRAENENGPALSSVGPFPLPVLRCRLVKAL